MTVTDEKVREMAKQVKEEVKQALARSRKDAQEFDRANRAALSLSREVQPAAKTK